jgi:transposase
MNKRYIVNLSRDERASLEDIAKRQRVSALKRQRALILLRADDDLTDAEIAEELEVGHATVERVRRRCVESGIASALERKAQENPSRPRKFDGASEAKLVQIACSAPPEGRAYWTLSLLGERLVELKVFESVSKSSVQRTLKKTSSSPGESRASASHPKKTRRS